MSGEAVDAPLALEQYAEDLRRTARARLGSRLRGRLDPSDLVQQTLLIGHAKRDQFRGATHAELRRWLLVILEMTLARAARRFCRCQPERALSLERSTDPSSARLDAWLACDDSTPSQQLDRGEQVFRLAAAMAALPDDQRTALELHHFQDLPVAEVAARMDRSVASVSGLLFRGGKALRDVLT